MLWRESKMACEIVCDGKKVGTITMSEEGISVKFTEAGKKLCKNCC